MLCLCMRVSLVNLQLFMTIPYICSFYYKISPKIPCVKPYASVHRRRQVDQDPIFLSPGRGQNKRISGRLGLARHSSANIGSRIWIYFPSLTKLPLRLTISSRYMFLNAWIHYGMSFLEFRKINVCHQRCDLLQMTAHIFSLKVGLVK